jgi:hypothetical protein
MKGIIILFLIMPYSLFSQGEWNQWRFGYFTGLDFNSLPPAPVSNSAITSSGSPVSVSDSVGLLLFYSDGNVVWNKNNLVMTNGTFLNTYLGNSQGCFSVKNLSDPIKYYLFSLGAYNQAPLPQGLFYSLIDMNLSGGLGGVVSGMKNIAVPNAQNTCNWMIATRHHNNKDVWLLVRNMSPNSYLSYKITESGIDPNPLLSSSLINPSPQPVNGKYQDVGFMKISQDGKYLVTTYRYDSILEVCNFNDQTGVLTPKFKIKYRHNNSA